MDDWSYERRRSHERTMVMGMSVEIFVAVIIVAAISLFILVGLIYRFVVTKFFPKEKSEEDEEDNGSSSNSETNEQKEELNPVKNEP